MKNILHALSLALLVGVMAGVCPAQTMSFDFSNLANQAIQFHGTPDTFEFSSAANRSFQITNSSLPSLVGFKGAISGVFTIGPVTSMVGYEQATVTGPGVFQLFESDASTTPLTADLTWGSVLRVGPAGILNPDEVFNLSNFQYAGADTSLQSLQASLNGTSVLTFQFTPSKTLTQLTTNGAENQTSYSGSVTTLIPEPSAYATILGLAVLVGAGARRLRAVGV